MGPRPRDFKGLMPRAFGSKGSDSILRLHPFTAFDAEVPQLDGLKGFRFGAQKC